MSRRSTAWEVAEILPSADGLTFRCQFIGDGRPAPHTHVLPRSHRGFRETFDLLLDALVRNLGVEVTTEEADKNDRLTVVAVRLNGQG
jgi:hypothetical protein